MTPTPHLLDLPHHDGSALHVSHLHPRLGDEVELRVRVPLAYAADSVHVRLLADAEPRFLALSPGAETAADRWWTVRVPVRNPTLSYRFLVSGRPSPYAWLNGAGLWFRDVPDGADFRLTTAPAPPAWARDAVVYQIFPDRFARSAGAADRPLPPWALPARWDDEWTVSPDTCAQVLYGGDLDGIADHLDHVESLGVDTVYLTPVFPGGSTHRYDAATFDHVDPLLGGDEALARLAAACHARGLRLLGDLTTNHTGVGHDWFRAALGGGDERSYYLWEDGPLGYAAWLDVPTLPKLDFSSSALRERFFGPDGVVRHWLRPPYELDGWRVDVANMTGRYRDTDHYQSVARAMRAAVDAEGDRLLVAEHGHDLAGDLDGFGWHGAMAYSGFLRPLWSWLRDREHAPLFLGSPLTVPRLGGRAVVESMRDFQSRVPWTVLTHSFFLASSHDTTRILTLCGGSADLAGVAAGLVLTMPGVPMICYGDEVGLRGDFGEDGRRPMPWGQPWPGELLQAYRSLGAARRRSAALRHGGLRWVHAGDDLVIFLREVEGESVLVAVARDAVTATLPAESLPRIATGESLHGDAVTVADGAVGVRFERPGVSLWSWGT